jgi:hypothetical protein
VLLWTSLYITSTHRTSLNFRIDKMYNEIKNEEYNKPLNLKQNSNKGCQKFDSYLNIT